MSVRYDNRLEAIYTHLCRTCSYFFSFVIIRQTILPLLYVAVISFLEHISFIIMTPVTDLSQRIIFYVNNTRYNNVTANLEVEAPLNDMSE